ncbi:MAG TPA: hypothetical protein VFA12_19820 [Stellaceae bacterium]|nr:hypothetical protein [Stellaceae bacterium]
MLAETLRRIIDADRYPLSPRVAQLRAIMRKLCPPEAEVEPLPAPKPPAEKSIALRRAKRRR